jgi:hypothetical protein
MRMLALIACVFLLFAPSTAEARSYGGRVTVAVPLNIKDIPSDATLWMACGWGGNAKVYSQAVQIPLTSAPGGQRFVGTLNYTVNVYGYVFAGVAQDSLQSGNTIECDIKVAGNRNELFQGRTFMDYPDYSNQFLDVEHSTLHVQFRLP